VGIGIRARWRGVAGGTPLEMFPVGTRRRSGANRKEQVMIKKQIGLAVVLVDFAALTAYVVAQYGIVGLYETIVASWASTLAMVDLTIALTMVVAWMWRDARARGVNPIPYALLTLGLGSVGPLLYLIRRVGDEAPAPHGVLAARTASLRA
jgi:hypothetical protein